MQNHWPAGTPPTQSFRTWLHATVDAGQALAFFDSPVSVWREAALLAARIDPPNGPLQRMVALHVLERAAWEMLRVHVAGGHTSPADAIDQWNRFLAVTETAAWPDIPERLFVLEHLYERPSVAVRVREFLDFSATTAITLVRAAEATGTSVRTLTTQFRRRYRVGVHQYVTRRRLAEAIKLLLTTDMKVAAIATSVGFRDPTAIYRQFTRVLNSTPKSVRTHPERAASLMRTLQGPDTSRFPGHD
jgi:AraC-like DNA-binding protein